MTNLSTSESPSEKPIFLAFGSGTAADLVRGVCRVIIFAGWPFLGLLLIQSATWFLRFWFDNHFDPSRTQYGWAVAIVVELALVFFGWLTIVATIKAADAVSDRIRPTVSACYSYAARRFWPYLVTLLLTNLIVCEAAVALVVPSIVFMIALSLATCAVVIEKLPTREALARSNFLTTGRKSEIFGRFAIFFLFCWFILWLPAVIVEGIPDWRWIELPPINGTWMGDDEATTVPDWFPVMMGFGGAVWTLLLSIFSVLLFKSLRAGLGEGKRGVPPWPAMLVAVIGVILLLVAGASFVQTRALVARAVSTVGTLIPATAATNEWGITLQYAVAAEFKSADGAAHQFQSFFTEEGTTDKPFGSPVPVLYDPANPSDATIDRPFFVWGRFWLELGLGAVLFLGGLAQWFYLKRGAVKLSSTTNP